MYTWACAFVYTLVQELDAQHGGLLDDPVTILPTIRINGRQYRGSLDAASE